MSDSFNTSFGDECILLNDLLKIGNISCGSESGITDCVNELYKSLNLEGGVSNNDGGQDMESLDEILKRLDILKDSSINSSDGHEKNCEADQSDGELETFNASFDPRMDEDVESILDSLFTLIDQDSIQQDREDLFGILKNLSTRKIRELRLVLEEKARNLTSKLEDLEKRNNGRANPGNESQAVQPSIPGKKEVNLDSFNTSIDDAAAAEQLRKESVAKIQQLRKESDEKVRQLRLKLEERERILTTKVATLEERNYRRNIQIEEIYKSLQQVQQNPAHFGEILSQLTSFIQNSSNLPQAGDQNQTHGNSPIGSARQLRGINVNLFKLHRSSPNQSYGNSPNQGHGYPATPSFYNSQNQVNREANKKRDDISIRRHLRSMAEKNRSMYFVESHIPSHGNPLNQDPTKIFSRIPAPTQRNTNKPRAESIYVHDIDAINRYMGSVATNNHRTSVGNSSNRPKQIPKIEIVKVCPPNYTRELQRNLNTKYALGNKHHLMYPVSYCNQEIRRDTLPDFEHLEMLAEQLPSNEVAPVPWNQGFQRDSDRNFEFVEKVVSGW